MGLVAIAELSGELSERDLTGGTDNPECPLEPSNAGEVFRTHAEYLGEVLAEPPPVDVEL